MTTEKNQIVQKFLDFQATGTGFALAWEGIGPIVQEFARRTLRKYGMKVWTANGAWAVDDVVSQTKVRLYELGQPGAKGRFDPAKTSVGGLSGLKAWLWRVVDRLAIDWTHDNCNTGDKKLFLDSDLEGNDPSDTGEPESIIKQQPAKIERADLLPILEELIGQLPDTLMQDAVLLKLHEGLSEAEAGKRLGVSDTTIHHRRRKAYAILRPQLEARGIDATWLVA